MLYNGGSNVQAWGLIVLLISKAAGYSQNVSDVELDKAVGVMHTQRALAEVTEMLRTSHLVHRGMVNLQNPMPDISNDMLFGNKIALLSGDYLLSKSCSELAMLRNSEITELMSSVVADLTEAEFIGPRDQQNNALPAKPCTDKTDIGNVNELDPHIDYALGNAKLEWTLRNILYSGSLLGKSCQGTINLAGHPIELQEVGYKFGKHLALAWQASVDQEPFIGKNGGPFNLISAPVLFHLQYDPDMYEEIEKGFESIENIDYEKLRQAILNGPGLQKTKQLQNEHSVIAINLLKHLPSSDARNALTNIIQAI